MMEGCVSLPRKFSHFSIREQRKESFVLQYSRRSCLELQTTDTMDTNFIMQNTLNGNSCI
jgi:hypothetical protein